MLEKKNLQPGWAPIPEAPSATVGWHTKPALHPTWLLPGQGEGLGHPPSLVGWSLWQQPHRNIVTIPAQSSCEVQLSQQENTSPKAKEAPRASGFSNFSEALSTNPETLGYLLHTPHAGPFEKGKFWGEKKLQTFLASLFMQSKDKIPRSHLGLFFTAIISILGFGVIISTLALPKSIHRVWFSPPF